MGFRGLLVSRLTQVERRVSDCLQLYTTQLLLILIGDDCPSGHYSPKASSPTARHAYHPPPPPSTTTPISLFNAHSPLPPPLPPLPSSRSPFYSSCHRGSECVLSAPCCPNILNDYCYVFVRPISRSAETFHGEIHFFSRLSFIPSYVLLLLYFAAS